MSVGQGESPYCQSWQVPVDVGKLTGPVSSGFPVTSLINPNAEAATKAVFPEKPTDG